MVEKYYKEIINKGLDKKILFKSWLKIGTVMGWLRRYNIIRDENLHKTVEALEGAMEGVEWPKKD